MDDIAMDKEGGSMTQNVYAKIAAVQGELAQIGISKDSENTYDKYKFRGIDAVYNTLAPLLAKHGLTILPRMVDRTCEERSSKNGGAMFYVTVTAEFDFVSADDKSIHVVRTYGEAMDRSDKATNKAMSAAYKYAAFMAFAIPTEGDNDADANTPEVQPRQQRQSSAPTGKLDGPYPSKSALDKAFKAFYRELQGCGDSGEFEGCLSVPEHKALIKQLMRDWPSLVTGGDDMPEEYIPLQAFVEARRRDFEMLEQQ